MELGCTVILEEIVMIFNVTLDSGDGWLLNVIKGCCYQSEEIESFMERHFENLDIPPLPLFWGQYFVF